MHDKPRPTYPHVLAGNALPGPGDPLTLPSDGYVLVVGGSPEQPSSQLLTALVDRAESVVAVDSGAASLRRVGCVPSLLLGDLDSIDDETRVWCEEHAVPTNTTTWQKDETDLELAFRHLADAPGVSAVVATGVLGGRLDHELAVLGTASRYPQLRPVIVADEALCLVMDAVSRPSVKLAQLGCVDATTFSVIALAGEAVVSEKGMRWNLESCTLPPLADHGVSNYITDAAAAEVVVEKGRALLIVPRTQG